MPTIFKTKPVRTLYSHLQKPHAYKDGDTPKYDLSIIIPNNDYETLQALESALKTDFATFGLEDVLIDCNKDSKYSNRKDLQDCYLLVLKSNYQPKVYDLSLEKTNKESYSGEYIIVTGSFYKYSFARNVGISTNLKSVLLSGKGTPIVNENPFEADTKAFDDIDDLPF